MKFWKYEGTGNDFVVVEGEADGAIAALPDAAIAALCDRHFGVGADGVLIVTPAGDGHDGGMIVRNADGSRPEMCGNGLRCVALHVALRTEKRELTLRTDAGLKRASIVGPLAARSVVRTSLGVVRVTGRETLTVAGVSVPLVLADAGNPHAIRFGAWEEPLVAALGPPLATHAAFPSGTNAEFAAIVDGAIDLVVWERGVGRTLACGTGAAATAVAAWEEGLLPRGATTVRLPGGPLVLAPAGDEVTLEGGARLVYVGEIALETALRASSRGGPPAP